MSHAATPGPLAAIDPGLPGPAACANDAAADPRDASVARLQRQFHCDLAQARRVHDTALSLHRDLAPDAPDDERRELAWACALHEMGRSVSHHDFHRHGAYLMVHADAPGFPPGQQRRIAQLILAQRGGLKKVQASLSRRSFLRQAVCLRLAAIHCHARRECDRPRLQLAAWDGSRHAPRWEPEGVAPDARTLHLLHEEAALWSRLAGFDLPLSGT